MRFLTRVSSWARTLLRREGAELEMDAELRSHIEMHAEDLIRSGTPRDEAFRQARLAFGGLDRAKEECREAVGISFLESLVQDVRFGLRMLRKDPGFTAVAVLTLALGIGANTAIFTIANAFVFRPWPVKDADRLTVVALGTQDGDIANLSYPDFLDYKQQNNVFTEMTGFAMDLTGLGFQGRAERIVISYVPSNFFSMLGLLPAAGRLIEPGDGDALRSAPVVVLGYSYWQHRFGGNPDVIGRSVSVDGQAATIIGVVEKEFTGPYSTVDMAAYSSIGMYGAGWNGARLFTDRADRDFRVLATLKPGFTPKQATAALGVISQRLAQQYPQADKGQVARVIPERLARPEP